MTTDTMFSFSIDRGGTFTDVHCVIHDRAGATTTKVMKLLSEDPANYADAPREGIRRFLEAELGVSLPRNEKIPTQSIRSIRMGTTVATNALLERRGERTALVVTKVRRMQSPAGFFRFALIDILVLTARPTRLASGIPRPAAHCQPVAAEYLRSRNPDAGEFV